MEQAQGWMVEPLDAAVDHVRGPAGSPVILEYGDYECPYSRQAFREIEALERAPDGQVRYAFRHFPLMDVHPHAVAASAAAEAAAMQDRFWDMHELLFHRQKALEEDDLRSYAAQLGLDVERFDEDRAGPKVVARVRRDFEGALGTGLVQGTPTIFIDRVLYEGDYDAQTLARALKR
jgi:protein-disulfide isomerase